MITRFFIGLFCLVLSVLLIALSGKLGPIGSYLIVVSIVSFFMSAYFFSTMEIIKNQEIAELKPILSEKDWEEIKRRIKDLRRKNHNLFIRFAFFVKILRPSDHFIDLDLSLDEIKEVENIEKIAYAKFKIERTEFGMSSYYKASNRQYWLNTWTELRNSSEYELLIESMAKMKLLTAEYMTLSKDGILFINTHTFFKVPY